MVQQIKTLFVILTLGLMVLIIAKPYCLRVMAAADFVRRRNIWVFLTSVAFVAPNFWVYALVAGITFVWGARRDSTPLAFYILMLHVLSTISFEIPAPGSIKIFSLDNYRLLALVVLLPMAIRTWAARKSDDARRFTATDFFVIAFLMLQLLLYTPYEQPTNTARRFMTQIMDAYLPYYVFSRALKDRRQLLDVLAMFCVTCAIFAGIAAVEAVKKWPFYGAIAEHWGYIDDFAYVFRGDSLRAQASAGHPLALGFMMSVAFGFWLYISPRMPSKAIVLLGAGWLWLGLLAAYSRAPWIVAVLIFFTYTMLQPNGAVKVIKWSVLLGLAGAAVLMSPLGSKIIDNLPFVGTVDNANVLYRQRLADLSWYLVWQNPLFGDPFVLDKMEEMRQGEGIIDLVNVYASMALFYGLVGLSLFCGILFSAMWKLFRAQRQARAAGDIDFSLLAANLLACLLGTSVMMATGSFGTSLALMTWILAGMAVGCERMVRHQTRQLVVTRFQPSTFATSRFSR